MTIAVTAASGQLGSTIARSLVARKPGVPIVGLARAPERIEVQGIEVRAGDYTDLQGMTDALAGVDTLLMVSLNTPPDVRADQHRTTISPANAAG